MSKKSILSGLLLASSVILLAACGQQSSQISEGESTDATVQTSASASRPFINLEEQSKGPGAHLTEIYQKNFSSIKGTWKNNKGGEITFDENGFTNGAVLTPAAPKIVNNMAKFGMGSSSGPGGASVTLIPQGVVHPDFNAGDTTYTDASDSSKDCLLIAQYAGALSDPNEFYYKVSE